MTAGRRGIKRARLDAKAKAAPAHRKITGRRRPNGARREPWVAPDDMPQEMVDLVKAGKLCGHKRSNGQYCKMRSESHQAAIGRHPPFHCKFHGGAVPYGMMPANFKPNLKHGIYSDSILPGEEEMYKKLLKSSDSIDQEIAVCKLRLARAVRQEMNQHEADRLRLEEEQMEVKKSERSQEDDGRVYKLKRGKTLEKRDWAAVVHKIVLELSKLYGIRASMDGDSMDAIERARLAKQALREARLSVSGDEEGEEE